MAYLLSEVVARRLQFILNIVDDDLNVYTVFETINARGLELSAAIPEQDWGKFVYRPGNLTLLESRVNRAIENALLPEKLEAFAKSRNAMTSGIADDSPEEWNSSQFDRRQSTLARLAERLWRSDFEVKGGGGELTSMICTNNFRSIADMGSHKLV